MQHRAFGGALCVGSGLSLFWALPAGAATGEGGSAAIPGAIAILALLVIVLGLRWMLKRIDPEQARGETDVRGTFVPVPGGRDAAYRTHKGSAPVIEAPTIKPASPLGRIYRRRAEAARDDGET